MSIIFHQNPSNFPHVHTCPSFFHISWGFHQAKKSQEGDHCLGIKARNSNVAWKVPGEMQGKVGKNYGKLTKSMEIVDGNDEWSKIDGDFKMTHSLRTGNLDEHGPFTDHLPEKAEFWNWWYYDMMMIKIDWYSFRDGLEKPTSWLYTRIFAWNGVCHWLRSKIKTCDYLGDLPLMLIKWKCPFSWVSSCSEWFHELPSGCYWAPRKELSTAITIGDKPIGYCW